MLRELFARLWKDESGAVIATEYLMLGSVVAVGSASGLAAMRDGVAEEYKEFGQGVREVRQAYTPSVPRGAPGAGGAVATGGIAVTRTVPAPTVATAQNMPITFACP